MDGRILEKNQFFSPETDISVGDETLILSADCDKDCYYIWSRINTLEIKYITGLFVYFFFFKEHKFYSP